MLNGVGGNTIEEAKSNMSIREFERWQYYSAKRGGLNTARRVDTSITTLTYYLLAVNGNKDISLESMLPWEAQLTQVAQLKRSVEELAMLLNSKSTNTHKSKTKYSRK